MMDSRALIVAAIQKFNNGLSIQPDVGGKQDRQF